MSEQDRPGEQVTPEQREEAIPGPTDGSRGGPAGGPPVRERDDGYEGVPDSAEAAPGANPEDDPDEEGEDRFDAG
ncbi:hypothetical protein MF406_00215 [Georgenia sp. TF02-10]|uniref:hypothetical protein n=1 Tax=Georgenia sp. TF02-10 TaxID=2917725 RepID=UPI001FA7BD80|nr:hypothetical protein [Georgenia sp. TF02-10]UNX54773.1 hypothetical protein MF406_00215 [Georgenia sp. TF02-10]